MTTPLRSLELFAGIGGISLGLEMAGLAYPAAFCEIDAFACLVLEKHWPGVKQYDDVRTLTATALERDGIGRIDVVTGGFPCQPHSLAGKRLSSDDERDLWSEFARVVDETRPRWVVAENVPGLLSSDDPAHGRGKGGFFGRVLRDLATLGFDAEWHCFPASALGAHHRRERVWLVAYSDRLRGSAAAQRERHARRANHRGDDRDFSGTASQDAKTVAHANSSRELQPGWPVSDQRGRPSDGSGQRVPSWAGGRWEQPYPLAPTAERGIRVLADGLSSRVDSLRTLGNAVVPQAAAVIGRAIREAEAHRARTGVMPGQIVRPSHLTTSEHGTALMPVRMPVARAETPRDRLQRLERGWDVASDAAHLLWAYDAPAPHNAAEIRAEYDRLTAELHSLRQWLEIEERRI